MNAPIPHAVLAPKPRPPRYFWTTHELATLRAVYPTEGPAACALALPDRDQRAIYQQARKQGLYAPQNGGARQSWTWNEAELEALRRTYRAPPSRGDIVALAQRLGKPRHVVCKRAICEGLVTPRFAAEPWSRAEEDVLRAHANKHPRTIRLKLAAAGYTRSETAVAVRIKRLGCDTTDPDHFTANHLARLMGVDGKTVTRWILQEGLPAKRRGTARVEAQGGDQWWIARKGLREWIKTHAVLVDLRKVDRFWFLDLAFGGGA